MDINDFRIEIRKLTRRSGKVVGIASVIIRNPEKDGYRIGGFKILTEGQYSTNYTDENGNNLWVAPPAYPDPVSGKLVGMFFMAEPLWKKLQENILISFLSHEKVTAR